ncbi:unannotated protein [freshwater metagenome]|uniref:Unannotated protein n=1 Tax=freshwater metagenome TaxID=449393 RepID=A0A6J6P4R8_9ZZZZ
MLMSHAIRLTAFVIVVASLAFAALAAAANVHAARGGHGEALYVIDHHGKRPTPTQLVPYEALILKVLRGCTISLDSLTNLVIHSAEKAQEVSNRRVTNYTMLRAFAAGAGPKKTNCEEMFLREEARLE